MHKRTIILGSSNLAHDLIAEISRRPRCDYSVIGWVKEERNISVRMPNCRCLGSLEDLQTLLIRSRPDHIIVAADGGFRNMQLDRLTEWQTNRGISIEAGVDAYEKITGMLAIESLSTDAILLSGCFRLSPAMMVYSRATSLLIASIALLFSLPIMAMIAIAIRAESSGPLLFIQERIGLHGRRFKLYKFRSMHPTKNRHSEWAGDNSDRITRVGRYLRKFRLDELPQLINVILGDMNLVGPRPHPSSNEVLFTLVSRNAPTCGEEVPYYLLRSSVRPGVTGWAQVRYKYADSLDEEMEKLRYDLYYIKHCNPVLELQILFETFKVVLFGHSPLDRPESRLQQNSRTGADWKTRAPLPICHYSEPDAARSRLSRETHARFANQGNELHNSDTGGAPN